MAVTATTAAWAQHFAALLEAAGWPGPAALGSAEQQVRLRFEQLLGEIAAAQEVAGSLDAGEAAALLDAWTQRVNFEVASGDVPVTVTASTDDPLVRYDGIWVAGLSADVWPASARGDAFVPYATLASAGLTMLSAAGQQQRARAAMRAWEQAGAEVIYSWPLQVDDAVLEASPLLLAASAAQSSTAVESAASPAGHLLRPFRAGLLQLGVATEPCGSDIAQRWPVGQRARHGVRLIQAQSQCPFQATAIGRLQCEPLVSPLDGITPPLHGQIIHHALEGIWKELQDSVALASLSDGRQALVHRHVRLAIAEYRKRVVMPLAAVVWQIEQQRCQQVLMRLLEAESQREAFAVSSTEEQLDQIIGGLPLQLRRDRVDRLAGADPRSIVIDYKTGKPAARNDWLSARPGETQLLCYALDAGPELCAIATLHVHTSGIAFKGVADQSGRLPRVSALKGHDWDELRALWHEHVHALGAAFVAGEARVAPLKRACDYCHLKLLCRVNADRLIDDERTGDDDGENDDV
jgi:probable DNA repair protein